MIPHQEQCSIIQKFMSENPKDTTVIGADNSFQKRISKKIPAIPRLIIII